LACHDIKDECFEFWPEWEALPEYAV
jgi:hypothetical protein